MRRVHSSVNQQELKGAARGVDKLFIYACIVLAVPVLLYLKTLSYEFVSWDDGFHIYENKNILVNPIAHIPGFWAHVVEIPGAYTAWAIIAGITRFFTSSTGPLSPLLFHGANVLLHALNCVLVFFALRKLNLNSLSALLGALLFACHPIQVESVAWVSSLKDLLSAFFGLLAILLHMKSKDIYGTRQRMQWFYILLSTACFSLSILSKATGIAAYGAILLIDLLIDTKGQKKAFHPSHALWLIVAIPYLLLTMQSQSHAALDLANKSATIFQRVQIAADAYCFYIAKILLPFNLCIDYGKIANRVFAQSAIILEVLAVFCAAGALIAFKKWRTSLIGKGLLFFGIILLPVSGLTPFVFQDLSIVADRYVYLGLFAIAFLFGSAVQMAQKRWALYGAIAILCSYAIISFVQTATWKNNLALYSHCLSINPLSHLSNNNLGVYYFEKKQYAQAEKYYGKAIELAPWDASYYLNLARVYKDQGRYIDAIALGEQALKINPSDSKAEALIGIACYWQKMYPMAIQHLRRSILGGQQSEDVYIYMSVSFFGDGQYDSCITYGNKQLAVNPNSADAFNNLGSAYFKKGDTASALANVKRAISLNPASVAYKNNLSAMTFNLADHLSDSLNAVGVKEAQAGNIKVAQKFFKNACEKSRKNFSALGNLASTYRLNKEYKVAIDYYEKALLLTTSYPSFYYEASQCYVQLGDIKKAREYLQSAINLVPTNAEYVKALNDLN